MVLYSWFALAKFFPKEDAVFLIPHERIAFHTSTKRGHVVGEATTMHRGVRVRLGGATVTSTVPRCHEALLDMIENRARQLEITNFDAYVEHQYGWQFAATSNAERVAESDRCV